METSTSNQIPGTISVIEAGPVTTQVTISMPRRKTITATMTSNAAEILGLHIGMDAIALVMPSDIVLVKDFYSYALSARNQFRSSIRHLQRGTVSSLVVFDLDLNFDMTASVANDTIDALALAVGDTISVAFKAESVMLAVKGN